LVIVLVEVYEDWESWDVILGILGVGLLLLAEGVRGVPNGRLRVK
jgi:hypothetical protein